MQLARWLNACPQICAHYFNNFLICIIAEERETRQVFSKQQHKKRHRWLKEYLLWDNLDFVLNLHSYVTTAPLDYCSKFKMSLLIFLCTGVRTGSREKQHWQSQWGFRKRHSRGRTVWTDCKDLRLRFIPNTEASLCFYCPIAFKKVGGKKVQPHLFPPFLKTGRRATRALDYLLDQSVTRRP